MHIHNGKGYHSLGSSIHLSTLQGTKASSLFYSTLPVLMPTLFSPSATPMSPNRCTFLPRSRCSAQNWKESSTRRLDVNCRPANGCCFLRQRLWTVFRITKSNSPSLNFLQVHSFVMVRWMFPLSKRRLYGGLGMPCKDMSLAQPGI